MITFIETQTKYPNHTNFEKPVKARNKIDILYFQIKMTTS